VPINYKNVLKGNIVSTTLKTLLENSGYTVIPFGIESVIREILNMGYSEYRGITEFNDNLRHMPDFFVIDHELQKGWLVEVKYRSKLDEICRMDLASGVSNYGKWLPIYMILVVKDNCDEPTWQGGDNTEIKNIRVFKIESSEVSANFFVYQSCASRIQDIFPKLKDGFPEKTIKSAQDAILGFASSL